ncbi:MAG: hypothetical protein KAT11_03395 [Phycisphaerae bacterium]|nr:hypothetical protein [Phycisphaerae bacterium]
MRTKILSILLAVSVAFNIFVIVGSFQAKKQMKTAPTFRSHRELLIKELKLDEDQLKLFQQPHQNRSEQQRTFLAELIKDKPDQEFLESFHLQRLVRTQEFISILRPEQKKKFVEIFNKQLSTSRETTAPPAE